MNKNLDSLVDNYIFATLLIAFIVYQSFKDLSEIFSYGIYKKEILTDESNIGFDIKIKMK
tara:strand:+ start:9220 stop:9399 length:180 start_codon:yes stop_codon:yes gene_type:complete